MFMSMNDDVLLHILGYIGKRSFIPFGTLNKQCYKVFSLLSKTPKETFFFGYAPLNAIIGEVDKRYHNKHYLRDHSPYLIGEAVVNYNRMDVFHWALRQCHQRRMDELIGICLIATISGRADILEKVYNEVKEEQELIDYIHSDVDLPTRAARHGHLNVLMLLYKQMKNDFPLNEWLFSDACKSGSLEVLKWLHSKNCPYDTNAYISVLTMTRQKNKQQENNNNNIEGLLKWLKSIECPWNSEVISNAAMKGICFISL